MRPKILRFPEVFNDFIKFNLKLYLIQFKITTRLYPFIKFINLFLQSTVLLLQILNLCATLRNFVFTSPQNVSQLFYLAR